MEAPGAGKGTQCKRAESALLGIHHLSVGEVLRAELNREGSIYGEIIRQNMSAGTVGPMHITVELLKKAMLEASDLENTRLFLIDGLDLPTILLNILKTYVR